MLVLPMLCSAVQANRKPMVYTQPDGSEVTLSQRGDEFCHYFLTEDGKVVVSDGEGYYFARPDASGLPVASKMLASDPELRTSAQNSFLATVDRGGMLEQASKIGSAKRALRQSQRKAQFRSAAAGALSATWPSGIGLFPGNSYPVSGSPKALIILVEFKDMKFTYANAKQYFTNFASQQGFSESGAHGSALDYFTASSNGKFTPDFDVLGPVTLSQNVSYYGANDYYGNDMRPEYMIREAMQLLDPSYDLSVYDTDGDGMIDNVYCIYAGMGEASGGAASTIWPHSWSLVDAGLNVTVDGKTVGSYACSAEYLAKGLVDGIGTFCHEFSHVLGLPDLYTTDYNGTADSLTPLSYSLMDYGSYNDDSRTPPTYSIYERNSMGWADIEELKPGVGRTASLDHMLSSNKGYVIATGKTNEFFLLENRQKEDWDAYIPGHGMLVWHIDYNESIWNANEPNNSTHQYVDIVEAGGKANNQSSTTMAQYPFPGTSGATSLTSTTSPALKSWDGTAINVPLTNIKESAGKITFDVCGGGEQVGKPVCNYTQAVVESDDPVTVTLALPATAKNGDEIRYIYMYNDFSDIVEGSYASPITISKSCEFVYWTQRGDMESEVTSIKFYIGEKAPAITSYRIVYKSNGSDSNRALSTSASYEAECVEGAEIASLNTGSNNVYPGSNGLKFSSSKKNGNLILDINADWQKDVTKVVVNARAYGNDAASLAVNGSASQNVASTAADYTFELDGSALTQLTLSATKRVYVQSITFYAEDGETPVDPIVPPVESYSHKIVFDDGGSEGIQITANNFMGSCTEGGAIAAVTEVVRVFYGNEGIKFGSSKGGGTLTLALNSDYCKLYTSVVVNAKTYGSDNSSLTVNGTAIKVGSEFADLTYTLGTPASTGASYAGSILTSLSLSSDKRLYVKSIELRYDADNTGVEDIDTDNTQAVLEYYNLQGIRIDQPVAGQICIMRQGNKVTKVLVR